MQDLLIAQAPSPILEKSSSDAVILFSAAEPSPVIASVAPEGDPIEPFRSEGDLWLSTWADDGALYSGWGDGRGVALHHGWTDCGVARFTGTLPDIRAEERCFRAPTEQPDVNDKPSSLLFLDGRLVGAFHSPLGDAWIGYLAVSEDYGAMWTRIGFYREGELAPVGASPWTRDRNSKFRCLFFVNMGQAYGLNTDGYVYALGIGTEWSWFGGVYLCRVQRKKILNYAAYDYFTGLEGENPSWSASQDDARPLPGVRTMDQGSVLFHPHLKRFLFLTSREVYDAPSTWGPWTLAGSWTGPDAPIQWQGGYQPGIITKDTGPDWFWFTVAGQNDTPKVTYKLHLGKMRMILRPSTGVEGRNGAGIPAAPEKISIYPNFPNPFNASTQIRFELFVPGFVTVDIHDIHGKIVDQPVHEFLQSGSHYIHWSPGDLPSGVYVVLVSERTVQGRLNRVERKALLLK